MLAQFFAHIFEDGEHHVVGCGASASHAFEAVVIVIVLDFDLHFEGLGSFEELLAVGREFEHSVTLHLFDEEAAEACLTDDGEQGVFVFIFCGTEVLQFVVMIAHHFGGLVAVEDIDDMFGFEFLF